MKKAIIILLVCLFLFCGCAVSSSSADTNKYANQTEFLRDMAAGITQRLNDDKDSSQMTAKEKADYYLILVGYELDRIEKYETQVFEDNVFNDLAHLYIDACQTQRFAAQNYKNSALYDALWEGGRKTRSAIIVELYSRYDLPITSEQAARYSNSGTSYSNVADNSTSKKPNTPYTLGTAIKKSCERGEAILSLDKVEINSTHIFLTATNHGDFGFTSGSGSPATMMLSYFDSEGYALDRSYAKLPEPWKPGGTIRFEEIDYSHTKYANDITYFMVEYFSFSGDGRSLPNTLIYFNYAFDLSGNQIDADKLFH